MHIPVAVVCIKCHGIGLSVHCMCFLTAVIRFRLKVNYNLITVAQS